LKRTLLLAGLALGMAAAQGQTQVALTPHNLSSSGPGTIKTANATGVCVFCHAPHNASATRALWNRNVPATPYQLYSSSTTKATLNQPTGSTRLCLSCHDGVLALESVRMPPKGVTLTALGPLTGKTVLGTNLSDVHPVSFVYDATLAASHPGLLDPSAISASLHLDSDGQMQCTTCHDPHENRHPNFLRLDDTGGALCKVCHSPAGWASSTHSTSSAAWNGLGTSPWLPGAGANVAQNACANCHRPHAAGHSQRLLAQPGESANCTICHGGSVAAKNVSGEFLKPSVHPIDVNPWTHDPVEAPLTMARHVACQDCHNAHASNGTAGVAPAVSGRLAGVPGVNLAGIAVSPATNEYEVCSRCHGLVEPATPGLARADTTRNIRLRIASSNPSYHPLAAVGTNATIAGLMPGYTSASIISCTSCHNSDAAPTSAVAPAGPHGSMFAPILERQYLSTDPQPYTPASYDLCFKCHDQATLMSPTNAFHHNTHVITNQATCATCHDPHGSRQNAHLIDFLLRDATGKTVVAPSGTAPAPTYTPLGAGHGQCDLACHGSSHVARVY
jgi:predicted CXXCH cytochrome family protein